MPINMTTEGSEALQNYLSRYRSPTERAGVVKALEYAGDMIAMAARSKVREDSGDLKRGIQVRTSKGAKALSVTVTTGEQRYASPLEHGHKPSGWNKGDMDVLPRPFMAPAFEENKREAYNLIVDAIKRAVLKG